MNPRIERCFPGWDLLYCELQQGRRFRHLGKEQGSSCCSFIMVGVGNLGRNNNNATGPSRIPWYGGTVTLMGLPPEKSLRAMWHLQPAPTAVENPHLLPLPAHLLSIPVFRDNHMLDKVLQSVLQRIRSTSNCQHRVTRGKRIAHFGWPYLVSSIMVPKHSSDYENLAKYLDSLYQAPLEPLILAALTRCCYLCQIHTCTWSLIAIRLANR